MQDVACVICNKHFKVKLSRLKKGWGKYCSNVCKHANLYRGSVHSCTLCGKSVYRPSSETRRSRTSSYFCDKSCLARWKNLHAPKGERHANWKGGEYTYRETMLTLCKNPTCRDCGLADTRVLIVHHIDEDRRNNRLENLVWLCKNCHYLRHGRKTV